MTTSQSKVENTSHPANDEPQSTQATSERIEPAVAELDAAGLALVRAVSEQAQLLAMLTGSVRAGLGPLDTEPPSGAVDLIGALGALESTDAPGSEPLRAFGTVAPRFVRDAAQVVGELTAGERGAA